MTAEGFGALFGKTGVFVAKQAWDRSSTARRPQFPHDELPSEAYGPIDGAAPRYEVSFAPDGGALHIERKDGKWPSATETSVGGKRQKESETELRYSLQQGLFAGGRLVLRINDGNLRVELTIYGSGLPIVASERGTFSPR